MNSASTRVLVKRGFERTSEVVDSEDGVVWRGQPIYRQILRRGRVMRDIVPPGELLGALKWFQNERA